MRVVVTGSAGRLGQQVVTELSQHGHDVVPLDVSASGSTAEHLSVDLADADALSTACTGAEAMVHLARERFPYTEEGRFDRDTQTWEMPDVHSDCGRFNRNVAMTYNVLAVSSELGLRKVVIGSSLAVYGFYYPVRPALPDYLPIDENHPLRPQDPYGLSKLLGEEICESFVRQSTMQIASLRFAGIATPAVYERLRKRRDDPMSRGFGSFWSYIDVQDAAIACCAALSVEFTGHQTFNICAPNTYLTIPTGELLEHNLPGVELRASHQNDFYCGYASEKAQRVLGFDARQGLNG